MRLLCGWWTLNGSLPNWWIGNNQWLASKKQLHIWKVDAWICIKKEQLQGYMHWWTGNTQWLALRSSFIHEHLIHELYIKKSFVNIILVNFIFDHLYTLLYYYFVTKLPITRYLFMFLHRVEVCTHLFVVQTGNVNSVIEGFTWG